MYISTKDWKNYITKLSKLNKKAAEAMIAYVQKNGFKDRDALIEFANAVVQKYGTGSAALTAAMYDTVAEVSGQFYEPAEMAELADYGEVSKTVNGVLKKSQNTNELASAVSRLVKQAGADTMLRNAYRDRPRKKYGKKKNTGAQIAWVPSGDTCPFCLVLASRGWQNQTVGGANYHAEHIHANCDCTYAVRFDERSGVEGYNPDEYLEMYENAEGNTPKEKINSLRRANYEKNKDKINAQKRAAYKQRVDAIKESKTTNFAKADTVFKFVDKEYDNITPQSIVDELEKTKVGNQVIQWMKDAGITPFLNDEPQDFDYRSEQKGRNINIYLKNNKNSTVAAQSTIHEMVHYRFHIGGCQHAEAVCFAYEKMHILDKTTLTKDEWDAMVKLAKKAYPEYSWEEGGYGNYEQFKFVVD